jgi:hypothetical protein
MLGGIARSIENVRKDYRFNVWYEKHLHLEAKLIS